MRKVSCSRCGATGRDEEIHSKCPDCNGLGWFHHWNEGQDTEELKLSLEVTRSQLEISKATLMEYVSGGQYADSTKDRKTKLERLRWERDYWEFRVNIVQGELELMGVGGGESIESSYS